MQKILYSRFNPDLTLFKDPEEVRQYEINYAAELQDDTISTTTVTGENITIDSSSTANNRVTITASGGIAGNTARIKTNIVTAAGITLENRFKIKVMEQ